MMPTPTRRTIARFYDGHTALHVMAGLAASLPGVRKADASTVITDATTLILQPSEYHETYNIVEVKA